MLILALFSPPVDFFSSDNGSLTITIKLTTFNIRYDTASDSLNCWKNRKKNVCHFLMEQDLDIICLQEVLKHQLDDICEFLEDYAYVGVGRTDGAELGEYNPIFFKKERYECLTNGTFWLSENPDNIGKKGWDALLPRIATWIKLKEVENGKVFIVVNTHLDHKGIRSREKSILQIKDFLRLSSSEYPIILTGDFNSGEKSQVYKDALMRGFPMNDSYFIAKKREGVAYSYHGYGKKNPVSLRSRSDYVFVTYNISVEEINIVKEKSTNGVYLSDHNPVLVKMSF